MLTNLYAWRELNLNLKYLNQVLSGVVTYLEKMLLHHLKAFSHREGSADSSVNIVSLKSTDEAQPY